MPVEVIVAIIGAIQAVGVAIIGGIITRNQKCNDEARKLREQREAAREQRDAANYDLIFSVADGVEVLLEQAHGERMNGNVENALESVRNAKSRCNRLYNEQVAKL